MHARNVEQLYAAFILMRFPDAALAEFCGSPLTLFPVTPSAECIAPHSVKRFFDAQQVRAVFA